MKRLLHYEHTDRQELQKLVEGDVTFSVLYSILGGECDHIFTDDEEIIICHSQDPYPVWVWCGDTVSMKNLLAIAECIKANFPLTRYNVNIDQGLIHKLTEIDEYFAGYNVKTELLSYRLDEINEISRSCDGRMELADKKDREALAHIWKDMAYEMEGYDFPMETCLENVDRMIEDDQFFVWRNDDGEIVATTSRGQIGGLGKVAAVYTLPRHRRCGYAINLVYGVTRLILDDGLTPALYTDGGYSASNDCYKKIGYRQVGRLCTVNKKAFNT